MASSGASVAIGGLTDTGRVREHNEDAFLVVDLDTLQPCTSTATCTVGDRGILLAVSDGMGGAKAGEIASAMSLDALAEELEQDGGTTGVPDRLRRVVVRASRRVNQAAQRPDRRGMGATLTAALFCGGVVHLAQIGDSRAYLLRNGEIRQVTHDQSYVQMLVDEGLMTPEEAETSPQKNVILQVMGQPKDPKVELGKLAVRSGDRLLLCSDGLTNAVPDQDIAKIAFGSGPLDVICKALVDAANAAGGPDNITVVLAVIA